MICKWSWYATRHTAQTCFIHIIGYCATCDNKYTSGAWSSKQFGGWSEDGLQQFNELYTEVQKDREKGNAVYVEERYRLHCANNTTRKRKRIVHDNEFTLKVDNFDDLLCR